MENKKNVLEEYMKKKNLTKKQLAQKCGVSVFILNSVSSRKKGVGSDSLCKISKATKIRVNDLLGL